MIDNVLWNERLKVCREAIENITKEKLKFNQLLNYLEDENIKLQEELKELRKKNNLKEEENK